MKKSLSVNKIITKTIQKSLCKDNTWVRMDIFQRSTVLAAMRAAIINDRKSRQYRKTLR